MSHEEPNLPKAILDDIQDNPAFLTCFTNSAMNDDFVSAFNKIANANINFKALAPSGINAMIDKATNFNGIIANDDEIAKFIMVVYDFVYIPMLNCFDGKGSV